jgi:hypothetical protein
VITAVPSTTTFTATPVGFNSTTVTSVAATVGDIGAPYSQEDASLDRTIQTHGTFGAAGSLSLYGSNDAANWAVSKDNTGAALAMTSVTCRNVFDGPLFYSPMVTTGDGTTSLNCLLLLRIQLPRGEQ